MSTTALPESNAGGPGRSAIDQQIETALKGLIDRYGEGLLGESGRLKSFLQDECPTAKREISVLLQALDEQIPQDILRVHSGEPLQSLGPRLAKRLSEQKAMAPEASRWAVRTWAQGLGVSAVSMDLGSAPAFPDGTIPSGTAQGPSAANDWIDLSQSNGSASAFDNLSSYTPSALAGAASMHGRPASALRRDGVADGGGQPGPVARPTKRWLAIAVLVLAAAGLWYAFGYHPLAITRVDAGEALVADGKKRDATVDFKPNAEVRSVEVRFLRGDGKWDAQPQTYPVASDAATQGHVVANPLVLRSVKAASATFEYVLVAADGKRSEPVEKTFAFAPGPADPPVIGSINAPRSVPLGKPYSFTINFKEGLGGKVVQVERRVVDSNVKWVDQQMTTSVGDLPNAKPGSLAYPFQPMNVASHQTLEFTLVDESGARSEPRQVTFDVAPVVARAPTDPGCTSATCGRVVAVREIAQQGEGTGIGAAIGGVIGGLFGHMIGKGRGNTAATVAGVAGGAVAGHQGEKYVRGTKSYELTIRLDNGSTRVVTQPNRFSEGERVHVSGSSVTAVAS